MRRFVFALIIFAAMAFAGCAPTGPANARVSDAWSRPMPAGVNGVVYLTISNTGGADMLLSAQSEVAQAVELHETTMEGGVASMRAAHGIAIPANGRAQFAPGGLHIMLVGLVRELRVGERFPLVLRFEKTGAVTVEVEVRL